MKVLIIDDNSLHLKMCSMLLERLHHDVKTAGSMKEMQKVSASMEQPDIALVDYRLEPGVTGIDILNYIRDTLLWKHTKCIALTADVGEQAHLAQAGFDSIIFKPVTEVQLAEKFKKYE